MPPKASSKTAAAMPGWLAGWKPYALLLITVAVVFGRTLAYDYTYLDDDVLVTQYGHAPSVSSAFTEAYLKAYYRPIVVLSLIMDASIGGTSPSGYHLTNILIHLATVLLGFRLMKALGLSALPAFLASTLFAVNPLAASAVAWIPGRNDSLMALFAVGSVYFLVRSQDDNAPRYSVLHLSCFFLALLSKETAIVLPLIAILVLFGIEKTSIVSKSTAVLFAGWVGIVILWYLLRVTVLAGITLGGATISVSSITKNLPALLELVGKMCAPLNLSVYPRYSTLSTTVGVAVLAVALVSLLIFRGNRLSLRVMALAWSVVFLLPGLLVALSREEHAFSYLECRGYLSIFGAALFVAFLLDRPTTRSANYIPHITVVVALIFALVSFVILPAYSGGNAFWEAAVRQSPSAAETHFHRGLIALNQERDARGAQAEYSKAVELDPGNFAYHTNLGNLYARLGQVAPAEREFLSALRIDSMQAGPHYNIACLYYAQNDTIDAEYHWKKSAELDPTFPEPLKGLVELNYRKGREAEGQIYVQRLRMLGVDLDPAQLRALLPRISSR